MVVDAVGSFTTWKSYFKDLTAAGGRVLFYHPIRWYTLPRINNRTHRELIVVDGRVGFIGGAGFGDHWMYDHGRTARSGAGATPCSASKGRRARPAGAFAENWLETSGEVLRTWSTSAGARRRGTARPWSWPARLDRDARRATG
jgi:cardiolipin synthase